MSVHPSEQWQRKHDAKVMQEICEANMTKFAEQDRKRAEEKARIDAIATANLAKWTKEKADREAEKARIDAIATANLAKWAKEKADHEAFQKLCAENKARDARAAEALKLARARLSAAEWEEWSSRIGDIARNGRPGYSSDDLLHDLRKWGYLEAGRFISKFDPDYIQPAVRLG
jgi:membrane protein involved in colicin uptake